MENQLVVFEMAQEYYGVDIAAVESIIKLQTITRLPQAPEYIDGVTNLRGAVIPVMDLRKRFGLPEQEPTRETRIVIANMGGVKVGIIVDAVTRVARIPDSAIEPPPQMSVTINSAFIKAIAKVDGELIILIDLGKVLTLDEKDAVAALA